MKHCAKEAEPASLLAFRAARPTATWDQTRDDALNGGQQAYRDIKRGQLRSQGGLCAYCEQSLATALDDATLAATAGDQRVEHYHSKSDTTTPAINWALFWDNLWVTCLGGTKTLPADGAVPPHQRLEPLAENLSCDAAKEDSPHALAPEGIILSPHEVPLYPHLFAYDDEGKIRPSPDCDKYTVPGNRLGSTSALAQSTITHFNLNCVRLCNARSVIWRKLRDEIHSGIQARANPRDFRLRMARKYLTRRAGECWREYFTLFRESIGPVADEHLRANNYAG